MKPSASALISSWYAAVELLASVSCSWQSSGHASADLDLACAPDFKTTHSSVVCAATCEGAAPVTKRAKTARAKRRAVALSGGVAPAGVDRLRGLFVSLNMIVSPL